MRTQPLYGRVIDEPSEIERKPLAYFNRALSWERQSIDCEAMRDYQRALRFEKDAAWRRDIQSRLEKVTPKCQKSEGSGSLHIDTSPAAFLDIKQRNPEQAQANYESYLDSERLSVCISLDCSYLSHRLSYRLLGLYNPNPCMGGGAVATFTKCERPLYQSTFRVTTITTASTANNISDPRMSALSSLMSSPYTAP
jgi:hypothetical protein